MDTKLRYQIDCWEKLPNCMSNTSRKLHIHVSKFMNDATIHGLRVAVKHEEYGTLFSCIVNGRGSLIDETVESFSRPDILKELSRFGFLVRFEENSQILESQLHLLRGAYDLGFDMVRILSVWKLVRGSQEFKTHIVAFTSSSTPIQNWLNNMYSPSFSEYKDALVEGQAIDLTTLSKDKHLDWSWLYNDIYNISDVLAKYNSELYNLEHRNLVSGKLHSEEIETGGGE